MAKQKHPFDVAAEQLEQIADQPVAGQEPSPHYWEMRFAADDSVGDYPQAEYAETPDWGDTDGLGPDGFPAVPIAEQVLRPESHVVEEDLDVAGAGEPTSSSGPCRWSPRGCPCRRGTARCAGGGRPDR